MSRIYRKCGLDSSSGVDLNNLTPDGTASGGLVLHDGRIGEFFNRGNCVGLMKLGGNIAEISVNGRNPEILKFTDKDSFLQVIGKYLDKQMGPVLSGPGLSDKRANSAYEAGVLYKELGFGGKQ